MQPRAFRSLVDRYNDEKRREDTQFGMLRWTVANHSQIRPKDGYKLEDFLPAVPGESKKARTSRKLSELFKKIAAEQENYGKVIRVPK